jgi:hypothetical protein
LAREHAPDLLVERVELGGPDRHRDGGVHAAEVPEDVVLDLDQDHERQVPAMRVGPVLDRPQTLLEREAVGLEVEVLDVEHLVAGKLEVGDSRVRVLADQDETAAAREEAAVRIGPHVELDLTDALVRELLIERRVRVLPRVQGAREREQVRHELRPRLDVVAVVRPEDLDLVQRDATVGDPVAELPRRPRIGLTRLLEALEAADPVRASG